MGKVCVALLVAFLWAATPASASELVYDPEGPTTRQDSCKRRDGAFIVDITAWAEKVGEAISAYNVENFTVAKRHIANAKAIYWDAYEPCSSYAKDIEHKCHLATNYYMIGIEAAATADVDRAFRYMRLGHQWVQKATRAVRRLRAYYGQI